MDYNLASIAAHFYILPKIDYRSKVFPGFFVDKYKQSINISIGIQNAIIQPYSFFIPWVLNLFRLTEHFGFKKSFAEQD